MRDAAAVLERLGELTASNEPYALEPRWDGAPVTSRCAPSGSRTVTRAAYIDADLLARPGRPRGARGARGGRGAAAGRAPREGADARARRRRAARCSTTPR